MRPNLPARLASRALMWLALAVVYTVAIGGLFVLFFL
jgi:hypothetical protein